MGENEQIVHRRMIAGRGIMRNQERRARRRSIERQQDPDSILVLRLEASLPEQKGELLNVIVNSLRD